MLVLRKAATALYCRAAGCDERRVGLPVMKDIHYRTGEKVFLACAAAARRCASSASMASACGTHALALSGALPLRAGAASRALLAFEPAEAWEHYMGAGALEALTALTSTDPAELVAELARVRAHASRRLGFDPAHQGGSAQ